MSEISIRQPLPTYATHEPRLILPDGDGDMVIAQAKKFKDGGVKDTIFYEKDLDVYVEPYAHESINDQAMRYHLVKTVWFTIYTHGTMMLDSPSGGLLIEIIDDSVAVTRRFASPCRTAQ